jgi:hypothetical protein
MFNVHLRINDAATGKPTAVRFRVTDRQGRHFAPLGHQIEFPHRRHEDVGGRLLHGTERWYYIGGSCEIPLPSGTPLNIEVCKGPQFQPVRETITLGEGQMAIRLTLERQFHWQAAGWFAGDMRCHDLPPHAALLEAEAEDVSVVQILSAETPFLSQDGLTYTTTPNLHAFSGQQPLLQRDHHLVAVNTLNRHPVLGSLALLHCHRPVFPLTFGGIDQTDDWSLADWCDQCHRKRGLVVWVDPFRPDEVVPPEALADLILGRIDAVEVTPQSIRPREWYRAWNAGVEFPLVGASGKDSNQTCLGVMRTFAQLPDGQELTLAAWIEAVRQGRTVVSTGPLLELDVAGHRPGDRLNLSGKDQEVVLKATVSTPTEAGNLELLVNGEIVEQQPIRQPHESMQVSYRWREPGWVVARVVNKDASSLFAHTSPVYVMMENRRREDPAAIKTLRAAVERTLDWVVAKGRFHVHRRREQLIALLTQARDAMGLRGV